MVTALVQLRQNDVDPSVTTDEIEDIDIEETGFQATYTKLAVAALPTIQAVPFITVDDAIRNFVEKVAVADVAVGGALVGRIRNEVAPDVKGVLAGWGVAL
jgi:hypothetical protein